MSRISHKRQIVMPSSDEDRAITRAAKADLDAQPLTNEQLKAMVPMRLLRGRRKSAKTKQLVSIRYSPEVLNYFRSKGSGWQSMIDQILLDYIENHSKPA